MGQGGDEMDLVTKGKDAEEQKRKRKIFHLKKLRGVKGFRD